MRQQKLERRKDFWQQLERRFLQQKTKRKIFPKKIFGEKKDFCQQYFTLVGKLTDVQYQQLLLETTFFQSCREKIDLFITRAEKNTNFPRHRSNEKKVKNKKSEEKFFYNEGSRLEKIFDNNWWQGNKIWLKKDFRHKLQ